jgi:hypothetical protein
LFLFRNVREIGVFRGSFSSGGKVDTTTKLMTGGFNES